MIDRGKVKKRLRDLRRYIEDREWSDNREDRQAAKVYWQAVTDAIELLKEQDTEIRQLRLALDIAKGTCKGIVVETDEKYMGDL